MVTARNPHPHSVVVTLAPSGDAGERVSFGYRIDTPSGQSHCGGRIYDDGATYFRAGETKRAVHDFIIGSGAGGEYVLPGDYTVRGGFGSHFAPPRPFVITP